MTEQGLIDVSDLSLEQLTQMAAMDDDVLGDALRRVTQAATGNPDEPVCAFNSAV